MGESVQILKYTGCNGDYNFSLIICLLFIVRGYHIYALTLQECGFPGIFCNHIVNKISGKYQTCVFC